MQGERRERVGFIWRAVGAERRQERSRAEQRMEGRRSACDW